jgi:hypothetical protein
MQRVQVGNEIFEFPDDMSDAEISAALSNYFKKDDRSFMQRTGDFLMGNQKENNIPLASGANLGLPMGKAKDMVTLLATTASDDRLKSGISKIIPEAQFDKDSFGNLVVISPIYKDGKPTQQFTRFYPNPQGLDVTDLMQAAGAVTLGQATAMTGGLLGLPTTGMLGGGLIGLTDAGLVELLSSKMSGDRFQVGDLPAGAAGGAIGAKVADVAGKLLGAFRSNPNAIFDKTGKLRPRFEKQLRDAGLDPNSVTMEALESINKQVAKGIDPTEAARVSESQTLPVSVPLTAGAVTGSKGQQLFEDAAASGAYGQTAENMMMGQRAKTQDAIGQNVQEIQTQVAKGSPIISEIGDAGRAAQEVLTTQRQAAQKQADDMFNAARQSGKAFLDEDAGLDIVQTVITDLQQNYDFSNIPKTAKAVSELDEVISRGGSIRDLFEYRTRVTNLADEGGVDGGAAIKLKKLLDEKLTDAMENALIYGDEATAQRWKSAVKNYKDFGSVWKAKSGTPNYILNVLSTDGQLRVSPEAASNTLFNVATNKLSTNPKMVSNILALKRQLPAEEFNQIRQEAFMRIAAAGKKAIGGTDQFSGVSFRREFVKLMDNNPALLKALFTKPERDLMLQFANVSARATGGATNPSNSANAAFNILGRLATSLGATNFGQFATRVVGANMLRGAYGAARVQSANRALTTPRAQGAGAGAGSAVMGSPEVQNPILEQLKRTTGLSLGPL